MVNAVWRVTKKPMSSVETGQMSAVEPERCFPCPLPQLRLNKPRGTYYIAFMAIISFPSLGDRSEAALFCLEVFLHFFGFNFEAGLAVEDASLCFVSLWLVLQTRLLH